MTKKVLILLFLFITFIVNAQTNQKVSVDVLASNFIKELQNQKIDTICVYKSYCVGSIMTYDELISNDKETCIDDLINNPVYVFWKEKGKTFLTKINYCWEFSKIDISGDNFWKLYFSNKKNIEKEKVKPYEFETYQNSKKIKHLLGVDHSCHQNFKFLINGKIIEKRFDDFALQEKNENSDRLNINYKHNINLKSKLIIDTLDNIVKNNTFKKIKSR